MDSLGNASLIALFGVLAVPLAALLGRPSWPPWARQAVVIAVCAVFAVLALWIQVDAAGADIHWRSLEVVVGYVATVVAVANTLYTIVKSRASGVVVTALRALQQVGGGVEPPPGGTSTGRPPSQMN